MNNFRNDYDDFGHINIIKKLEEKIGEHNVGYGKDKYSKEGEEIIRKRLNNNNVDVHFVHGGTMVNILALSHSLKHYEAVVSARTGHIIGHETGAIEATGHKIITIETKDGKLSRKLLEARLKNYEDEIDVMPRIVYISNTTELGSVYLKEELEDLYSYCNENGLYLYIDGARLASALTSSVNDVKFEDLPNLCHMFTIGGTKNGAMFGEALVIVGEELKKNFRYTLKQRGAMLAKGFLLGLQFKELFKDDLYFNLGKKSNEMAELLAEGFKSKGVKLDIPHESNQIFIQASKSLKNKLEENNRFEVSQVLDGDEFILRFVTSYRTTREEVESLLEDI